MFYSNKLNHATTISVLTMMLGFSSSTNAAIAIPDVPIFLGTNIQPNIMFAVDDSGSMDWEVLKSQGALAVHGTGTNSGNLDFSPNDFNEDREMCSGYNVLAYDPAVTYTPWIGENTSGTTFSNTNIGGALVEPYASTNTRNLLNADGTGIPVFFAIWTDTDNDGVYDNGECPIGNNNGNGYTGRAFTDPRFIFVNTLSATGNTYTNPISGITTTYTDPRTGLGISPQQNYANWYSYYRKREYVLKRAMSELITDNTNRMGLATLWNRNDVGTPIRDMTNNVDKEFLEDQMFRIDSNNGTPLRALLNNVGRYIDDTDGTTPTALGSRFSGEASPILSSALGGECQQNFTVLMSDGYWNGNDPGVGNEDGDNNTQFDGGPHSDGFSNTLADVAMRYYERDLSGLPDNVPQIKDSTGNALDDNDTQHMVTYTVAFGLTGTGLTDPANHDAGTPAPPWTQPVRNTATTLDDMQHAAFNSRGLFLNADNPQNLINSLNDAIGDIDSRSSFSASAVSFDSAILTSGSRLFAAKFDTTDYSGSLRAISVDALGNLGAELWDTANTLTSSTGRNLFTIVNKSGTDTPIDFNATDADLVTAVSVPAVAPNPAIPGADIINYISGLRSLEQKNGGSYRNRETLLGDIIASSPVVATANDDYGFGSLPGSAGGSSYPAYLNSKQSTFNNNNAAIFAGSNAGVLHVINANNGGQETYAYVPKTVHQNLNLLLDPNYGHKFYINAPGGLSDAYVGGSWTTVYVSALGEGGRGIFALDAKDPFSNNNPAMWERNSNDVVVDPIFEELGYIKHKPTVVPLNNGEWGVIVGNGYNSKSEKAQLFIINLKDGSIIKTFDTQMGGTATRQPGVTNGMAEPLVLDLNGDRIFDVVYVGDLLGNLWKIDISDSNESNWDFAYGSTAQPDPMFAATESGGTVQPITTAPDVVINPSDNSLIITFGTGKYLENNDNYITNPVRVDSFYGINDTGVKVTRNQLVQQTITSSPTNPIARFVSNNNVDYTTNKGWYIDFDLTNGEMIVANHINILNFAVFVTYVPSNTPCQFGGSSYLYAVDALSGGRTQNSVFDFNNDGTVDNNDEVDNQVASGKEIDSTIGGLGQAINSIGQDIINTSSVENGSINSEIADFGRDKKRRTSWRILDTY